MKTDSLLFQPITINKMELKNRIGFAPLLNMPRAADWGISDQTIAWFEARAKGGTGFLMTGTLGPMNAFAPDGPERFKKLADAVHKYGSKIAIQIGAGGPMGGQGPSPGPFPSALDPKPSQFEIHGAPHLPVAALTLEQMQENIEAFSKAAAILKETGVDAVELHCAHGGATLYCSFISPFYNHRTDEYGGSWENRLRFPVETIKAMRKAVGPDFPLLARMDADELLGDRGIRLEDAARYIAPALEGAGLDCLDVTQGSIVHSPGGITIPMYYPRGCYIHNAAAIKKVAGIPVIGVGRIVDLNMAEKFLEEGKADIIYMGRQITADPDTPNKYYEGRQDEIRECIGCLEGCGTPCPINYDIQPEPIPLTPAETSKHILVIGGGVAGMEAARVCSERGHKVTLFEKGSALGGTVASLALNPLNVELGNFPNYLGTQMRKLDVDVRVCKEATVDNVTDLNPDVVILATGASLRMPDVVSGKHGVMDHIEALKNRSAIGPSVVIWGLIYGAELAIALANDGKNVTLIGETAEDAMTSHTSNDRKLWVLRKLTDVNVVSVQPIDARLTDVRIMTKIKVDEINAEGIRVTDKDGRSETLSYDTLIISRGRKSNDGLFEQLQDKVKEIHKIGDCDSTANIKKAVWSANEIARKI